MASIITATTTSGLTQSADNSGVLQLASGTGNLVTVPSVTGTAMVSGNQQGFSAYLNANQSIGAATFTKVQFDTTDFNLGSAFNTSTYRFTPTVAGYYQVNLELYILATGSTQANAAIYKNGSLSRASYLLTTSQQLIVVPAIIYMNGSTDYLEAYAYSQLSGIVAGNSGNAPYCYFQAMLIRTA